MNDFRHTDPFGVAEQAQSAAIEFTETDSANRFPYESLPNRCQPFLKELIERHDTKSLAPLALMATASAALGRNVGLMLCGMRSRPNLYITIAVPSSGGKSLVSKEAIAPLRAIEEEMINTFRNEKLPELTVRKSVTESKLEDLTRSKSLSAVDQEEMTKYQSEILEMKREMAPPRIFIEDATTECLGETLCKMNGGPLFSVATECQSIFRELKGGYDKGGSKDAVYNSGWSGDPLRIDRKNNGGTLSCEDPSLTSLWLPQPSKLEELEKNATLAEDGLLARHLKVYEHDIPAFRVSRELTPFDAAIRTGWHDLIRELFFLRTAGEILITPTEEAHNYYVHKQNAFADDIDGGREGTGKCGENLGRLMLVFHFMRFGKEGVERNVDIETAEAAYKVCSWASEQASADRRSSDMDKERDLLKRAVLLVNSHKEVGRELSFRNLQRGLRVKKRLVEKIIKSEGSGLKLLEKKNKGAKPSQLVVPE